MNAYYNATMQTKAATKTIRHNTMQNNTEGIHRTSDAPHLSSCAARGARRPGKDKGARSALELRIGFRAEGAVEVHLSRGFFLGKIYAY